MRIAILSDIHGNLDALKAVFKDIKKSDIDKTISLGDNVGYGPEPHKVISLLQKKIPSIAGNHEQAVFKEFYFNTFNKLAQQSIEKTITFLSEADIDYIKGLPVVLTQNDIRFVHEKSPRIQQHGICSRPMTVNL
jgi:predicted phosphodiesterase